ncbi:MAG: hypothetical protein AAFQ41_14120 [Cyanobacteria bacterium J06623_7]
MNNPTGLQEFTPLRIAAERILSTALSSQIQLDRLERMTEPGRRNLLIRCWSERTGDFPPSFIIKKVEGEYNPDRHDSADTKRFFNDWIGTQFLNTVSLPSQHSPLFYGGDRILGLIVIEDVEHHDSLAELLLGNDRSLVERALLQYATCLGQLHRDTVSKIGEFERLYRIFAPGIEFTRASLNIQQLQARLNLVIELDCHCLQDIETINQMLLNPGEFLTYVHTDACPDNVLDAGNKLRLIDFETGRFEHAFIDATCGRMMFPSCWCSQALPLDLVQKMEQSHRSILSEVCPSLEDDCIFETALVNACGMWLLYTVLRHLETALVKEQDFGVSTIRQRILARLDAFIHISTQLNRLEGLRSTSSRLLEILNKRWSDVPKLSSYPAFAEE